MRGGSNKDRVTIVAAGITLHEALKAVDVLAHEDIAVRVIDLYTVKPIDTDTLADAVRATMAASWSWRITGFEGGIGDAVLAALAERGMGELRYRHLAVRKMPGSGKPVEMLDDAGISTVHIVRAVKALLG